MFLFSQPLRTTLRRHSLFVQFLRHLHLPCKNHRLSSLHRLSSPPRLIIDHGFNNPNQSIWNTLRKTKMWFTRGFSLTNFVIGTSALSFQVFVLYPWHEQLDEEFKELRKEHARLLDETHRQHRQELRTIREQLEALNQTKGRGWFR
jgi:hypothetical protein